jgi:eukaryotic-like serine/threonine-protein kinase
MPLPARERLGPYEVLELSSARGDGESYKASDTRTNRIVALHMFPPEWPAERKESFEREARAVASLGNPHICAPEEFGQQNGIAFFVTEHIEGQTLAVRLKGRPMDPGEVLAAAIAIAGALDQAHRAGIGHRGLNPSNIVFAKDGVKVLDFGWADPQPADAGPGLAYTAPEMLRGASAAAETASAPSLKSSGAGSNRFGAAPLPARAADARADFFSLGAILYEMIAGKPAFEGKTPAVLMAALRTADPNPLPESRPGASPALERAVQRCLAKDPEERWQTAHDLLIHLQWIAEDRATAPAGRISRHMRIAWIAAGVLAAALALPAALYFRGPGEGERFQFRVPVRGLSTSDIAISPDGRTLAVVAQPTSADTPELYVRRVGALAIQKLGGTAGASQPFWSPDSRFIGFVADGRLKKVSAAGGAPQNLTGDVEGFSGGTWNRDGTILFGSPKGLFRVSAEGGAAAPVTTAGAQETGHLWPNFLPDGRHFLYLAGSEDAANGGVFVGSLDSREKVRLTTAESNAVYAAPGYVLFHRDASLFAQPFDARKLALRGEPIHVADEVSGSGGGRASFDVSQNGALIYFQGANTELGRAQTVPGAKWAWFDASGKMIEQAGPSGPFGDIDLSPDGKLIAVSRQEARGPADIWLIDWQRAGVITRLTLDPGDNLDPVWSPDGKRVAFTTYRKGNADIYVKNADGTGAETPLLETSGNEIVKDWSKDGRYLAYLTGPAESRDIWMLPLEGDRKPLPVVQGHFQKSEPQFSYDGKLLAYVSNETGAYQVNVMVLPAGARIQVSKDGGGQPRWRRDGKQLYYRSADAKLMAVDIHLEPGGGLSSGAPTILFGNLFTGNGVGAANLTRHMWAPSPDGKRFLLRLTNLATPAPAGATANSVPQAESVYIVPGQQAVPAARPLQRNIATGLTVIQHWASAPGKAGR